MAQQLTEIRGTISSEFNYAMDAIEYLAKNDQLGKLGLDLKMPGAKEGIAMDAGLVAPVLAGSTGHPEQFLQEFLPGFIYIMQKKRSADRLAPIVTSGDFYSAQIVIRTLEHLGRPQQYSDHGGVNLASWNDAYEIRDIVRHELGALMSELETGRANKAGIDSARHKRMALMVAFEILRNEIFFRGFNVGGAKVYGFLNDPNLPAFNTVANGANGTPQWSTKTVEERKSDLLTAFSRLRSQSGSNVDPKNDTLNIAIASDVAELFHSSNDSAQNGQTVMEWLNKNYPKAQVIPCEELNNAEGGNNVFYVYPERVGESGDDDELVFCQLIPERLKSLNTVTQTKGVLEAYANALAGCLAKRGYAVVRYAGV